MVAITLNQLVQNQRDAIRQKIQQQGQSTTKQQIVYPTIVITHFYDSTSPTSASASINEMFYNELIDWAAYLATNKIAHVILVSSSGEGTYVGGQAGRQLSQRLMGWTGLERISLGDASPEQVETLLGLRIREELIRDGMTVNDVMHVLGWRLNDLETLVHKVKTGLTVEGKVSILHYLFRE
jgi:hypothetical protein